MTDVPDRERFIERYAAGAPWDIGKPQQPLVDVAEQVRGSVLDAGCGTGEAALFFAGRGNAVTGFDFLEGPVQVAKQKAAERGLDVRFLVKDAMTLKDWGERFDDVIDSGLFHVFSDEDRKTYVAGLATVLKPGGRVYLMCFSDEEPGSDGPRRVSQRDLQEAFAQRWQIESLERAQFATRPDLTGFTFSPGGPKAWFAVIRRLG
jgi:SAM-dependent methyltransferase